MPGNAVSSLRGRTRAEKSWWAQGSGWGGGGGGSWAPEASESHHTPVIALPRLSPLWDAVRPAVYRVSGIFYPPGAWGGERREQRTTPLAFFSAPTLPRPTRLRPQGEAGSFLAKAQPLSSWLLPGWASASSSSSSSSSGPANLALRVQAPKLAIWSEPTGLLRTKVGAGRQAVVPSLVAQKRQALPSSRSRTSDLRMSVQV